MSKTWIDQIAEGIVGLAPHARFLAEALDDLLSPDFVHPDTEKLRQAEAEVAQLEADLRELKARHDVLVDYIFRLSQDLAEKASWETNHPGSTE